MANNVQDTRSRLSRYARTTEIDINGITALRSTFYNGIPFSDQDHYLIVDAEFQFRLDLVSFKYYGTSRLWWVIALASGIRDPILDVTLSTRLRIPTLDNAIRLLGT